MYRLTNKPTRALALLLEPNVFLLTYFSITQSNSSLAKKSFAFDSCCGGGTPWPSVVEVPFLMHLSLEE